MKPPFAVPTKEVYQEIDSVDILEHPDNKGMMAALNQEDYEGVCAYLSNVMETVTAAKRRQIGEIKSFLAENGSDGAQIPRWGRYRDERLPDRVRPVLG